jgi:hypothetical protein
MQMMMPAPMSDTFFKEWGCNPHSALHTLPISVKCFHLTSQPARYRYWVELVLKWIKIGLAFFFVWWIKKELTKNNPFCNLNRINVRIDQAVKGYRDK